MSTTEPVTYVRSEDLLAEPLRSPRAPVKGLGRRRQLSGLALTVLVLPLLTLFLDSVAARSRSRARCCSTCWRSSSWRSSAAWSLL